MLLAAQGDVSMFHEHKIYSSRISYFTVRELNESERSRGSDLSQETPCGASALTFTSKITQSSCKTKLSVDRNHISLVNLDVAFLGVLDFVPAQVVTEAPVVLLNTGLSL